MTSEELDEFLGQERVCRVATSPPSGPHITALWFVWDGRALWLYSIVNSKRWRNLMADPRVAVLVDAGVEYNQLRGAELAGIVEVVGEVPRVGEANSDLQVPEGLFARKYIGVDQMIDDHKHAWLRITPTKITSWDFRKMT